MPKLKKLFIDIEVSPNLVLSWRTGFNINLAHDSVYKERTILTAAYAFDDKPVVGLTWNPKTESCKAVVKEMIKVMDEADIIIGQNHDRFDMKWLRTMAIAEGLSMKPNYKTIDTLKLYKKYFLFNSNKQDYVSKFLTGEGKIKTDFSLWVDTWIKKDPKALAYMLQYNMKDVEDLRNCYNIIAPYVEPKSHEGVANGSPSWSCPHCGSYKVRRDKRCFGPTGIVRHSMFCTDCKRYYSISDSNYLAWENYKSGK